MEWLPHFVTAIVSCAATFIGTYVWFKKQMLAVAAETLKLGVQQNEADAKKATAAQAHDAVASEAWKKLFDECETRSAEQTKRIDALSSEVIILHRENAVQGAQIKILEAKIAQLEQSTKKLEQTSPETKS